MRKSKILAASLALTFSMSFLLTGCGKKETKDNKTTETQTEQSKVDASETDSESSDDAPTTEATTTETSTEVTTEAATGDTIEEWEIAMTSGTENAFTNYFDIDVKPYTSKIDQAGETTTITYHSDVIGADREAYVYTPYGYNSDTNYPVVYLIHGIGCDGGQWVSMGAAKIFDNMIANGEIKPFVAVFPSVIPADGIDPNTLSDTNIKAFSDFVEEFEADLAPYIKENYSISDKREDTALCGLSMGGMEALRLGFSKLDTFNYIGSFSAAPTLEMELLTTEGSDYTPALVLICSGDKDGTVNDNPLNYHKKLAENNVEHIWYQHPGGGHDPNVWKLGLVNFLKRTFQ